MTEKEIGPVRPIFNMSEELPKNKKVKRLVAGTNYSGAVIDITKDGIEINAYYTSYNDTNIKYGILRQPIKIDWEELEKIRSSLSKNRNSQKPDRMEYETDKEYLDTLPIVTLNGSSFYIDPEKRERRPVSSPEKVWKY